MPSRFMTTLKYFFLFFNWKIIALQNFVVFYQHIYCPSWSSLPSPFPSHSQVGTEPLFELPETYSKFPLAILKVISSEYSLEGLRLKLKLQYFGHLMWRTDSGKDPDAEKDWGQKEKGMKEDEIFGWHHWLGAHEFEQAPGVGDGQGGLLCCSPWSHKGSDTTRWLTGTVLNLFYIW